MKPNHRQRRSEAQREKKYKTAVAEVYSPPRITKVAREMGMSAAWALDLTEVDPEDGLPWDLSKPEKRRKAMSLVDTDKPLMLIGCPMCGALSTWQNINYAKMSPEERAQKIAEALLHLRFTVQLCMKQANGR